MPWSGRGRLRCTYGNLWKLQLRQADHSFRSLATACLVQGDAELSGTDTPADLHDLGFASRDSGWVGSSQGRPPSSL